MTAFIDVYEHFHRWANAGGWHGTGAIPLTPDQWRTFNQSLIPQAVRGVDDSGWPTHLTRIWGHHIVIVAPGAADFPPPTWPLERTIPIGTPAPWPPPACLFDLGVDGRWLYTGTEWHRLANSSTPTLNDKELGDGD